MRNSLVSPSQVSPKLAEQNSIGLVQDMLKILPKPLSHIEDGDMLFTSKYEHPDHQTTL